MHKIFIVLTAVCSFVLSGCALLLTGSQQNMNLVASDGEPHHVSVRVANQEPFDVNLPTTINVKRNHDDIVVVVKDSPDGEIGPTRIRSKFHDTFLMNVVFFSPLGSSIDCISGAMWRYDTNVTVNVTKEAVEAAERAEAAEKAKKKEKQSD